MTKQPDPWADALEAPTLFAAHEALSELAPPPGASLSAQLDHHRRSKWVYERIADVDRGHHHEALYWVGREQRKADEIAHALTSENVAS